MSTMRRVLLGLAVALVAAMALSGPKGTRKADAHPLGNFTINHLAKVVLTNGEAHVRYVVDMAEIPAFQEIRKIDKDGDGTINDVEGQAYLKTVAPQIASNLELKAGSSRIALTTGAGTVSTLDGQGGLKTLRIVVDYTGTLPQNWTEGASATIKDSNYSDRLGWREVIVQAGPGVTLTQSTATTVDETAELTAYPESRLKSPPDVREAHFKFEPGDGVSVAVTAKQHSSGKANSPSKSLNGFAGLVSKAKLTPAFIALSMLAAVAWGAAHALGPGHGKTIVAAYLVGEKGTAKHAAILGLTVTATHTSTVFALGLVTLSFSHLINTEDMFLWLSVGSGVMVVVMGLALLLSRIRIMLRNGREVKLQIQTPLFNLAAPHANPNVQVVYIDVRKGAHSHGGIAHSHAEGSFGHDHGPNGHSHMPTAPGIKGLIALGISGGLLPCPTALVVMLGAIALGRTTYGLALVLAFSFGLAGVLTGIGLLMVYARRFFEGTSNRLRFFSPTLTRRALLALPVLSSLAIVAVGVALTTSALAAV